MAVSEVFLTHIGGVDSVTGSCTLITIKKGKDIKRILVDFGTYQEERNKDKNYSIPDEINPSEIDAVILTHAHADHAGLLGRLAKHGFNGRLYVTQDTAQVLGIQLQSCTEILNNEAKRIKALVRKINGRALKRTKDYKKRSFAKRGEKALDELRDYAEGIDFSQEADITLEDVSQILSCLKAIPYNKEIEIFPGIKLKFTFNNHMLGSAIVDVEIDRDEGVLPTTIEFTGDLGRGGIKEDLHMLYCKLKVPDIKKSNLVLITEATYGDRKHSKTMQEAKEELLQEIANTIKQNGRVIIPAFSLERTQEIIYIINEARDKRIDEIGDILRTVPITIDSPTSVKFTSVYSDLWNDKRFSNTGKNYFSLMGIKCASTYDEHIQTLYSKGPQIIITTSGMGDKGRILDYYETDIEDEKSKFIFCGYTPPDSFGTKLLKTLKNSMLFIKKDNVKTLKADVIKIEGLSSHADKEGLLEYVKGRVKKGLQAIIVMHGDRKAKESLQTSIGEKVLIDCRIPESSNNFVIMKTGKLREISLAERDRRLNNLPKLEQSLRRH